MQRDVDSGCGRQGAKSWQKIVETGDGEAQQLFFPFLGWSTPGMDLLISWMPSRSNTCYEAFLTRSLESFIVLDFSTQNLDFIFLFFGGGGNRFFYTCGFFENREHMGCF